MLPHFSNMKSLFYIVIFSLLSSVSQASPWLDSGDNRLRHHIQLLADKNIITVPVTTWPLMWSDVIRDVSAVKPAQLDEQSFWSLRYVNHAFDRQSAEDVRLNASLALGNEVNALKGFSDNRREKAETKASIDWQGERLAFQLAATHADNSLGGNTLRADGSFISYRLGNWALTAGAIDRWWGPGWHSTLTLSNNARPIPALSLQRRNSDAFKLRGLSWLGPWQFVTMMGQLESNRHIPDAYFLAARVNFKPTANLEIALSRTAQWGGEGRPQDWSSLKGLILGDDNRGSGNVALDASNEPGNQQGSIDMRYHFSLARAVNAIYFQFTGEDEANGLPSRGMVQLGVESRFLYRDIQHHLILEATDTRSEAYSEKRFNYAYEHGIYKTGYRYKQRPIGASIDNDSQYVTIGMDHYLVNGQQLSWSLSRAEINTDRVNVKAPSGSVFGRGADTDIVKVSYHFPFGKKWQASLGLQYMTEKIIFNNEALGSNASLTLDYRYCNERLKESVKR